MLWIDLREQCQLLGKLLHVGCGARMFVKNGLVNGGWFLIGIIGNLAGNVVLAEKLGHLCFIFFFGLADPHPNDDPLPAWKVVSCAVNPPFQARMKASNDVNFVALVFSGVLDGGGHDQAVPVSNSGQKGAEQCSWEGR